LPSEGGEKNDAAESYRKVQSERIAHPVLGQNGSERGKRYAKNCGKHGLITVAGETLKVRGEGMGGVGEEEILAAPGKETQSLRKAQVIRSGDKGGFGKKTVDIEPPWRIPLDQYAFLRRPDTHDQNPARTEKKVL